MKCEECPKWNFIIEGRTDFPGICAGTEEQHYHNENACFFGYFYRMLKIHHEAMSDTVDII